MKVLQGRGLDPKARLAARLRLQEKLIVQVCRRAPRPELSALSKLQSSFLASLGRCVARLGYESGGCVNPASLLELHDRCLPMP